MIRRGPWVLNEHLSVFVKWRQSQDIREKEYELSYFWTHLYDLSLVTYTWNIVGCLLEQFLALAAIELHVPKDSDKPFFKIKVRMDISKPIVLFVPIMLPIYEAKDVPLRYKKLPFICFSCGRIDHIMKDCSHLGRVWQDHILLLIPMESFLCWSHLLRSSADFTQELINLPAWSYGDPSSLHFLLEVLFAIPGPIVTTTSIEVTVTEDCLHPVPSLQEPPCPQVATRVTTLESCSAPSLWCHFVPLLPCQLSLLPAWSLMSPLLG